MGTCRYCEKTAVTISDAIGFCADCIRDHFPSTWPEIKKIHDESRQAYGLLADPPYSNEGPACPLCLHQCRIPEGGKGFCGIRRVESGKLKGGRPHEGKLSFYFDPLPTNCVGSFVCPGGTGRGYPQYAVSDGPEIGYKNLAVFYHACSFNCLYCQNYHFKEKTSCRSPLSSAGLAGAVDEKTACICYFGGDPAPQILHALKASKLALEKMPGRILRICWETNGAVGEPFITMMADLSIKSGGCLKLDLKAWDEHIHLALCGVTNKRTLENFEALSRRFQERPNPPFLLASTLLVPGYVDEREVESIAGFVADLNPEIPYSLLAFHPHFYLTDLPTTSRRHSLRCKAAAEQKGLKCVHIGNVHLLSDDY